MYTFGMEDQAAKDHVERSLEVIDLLTSPEGRAWASVAPAEDGEIARLERKALADPVLLSHSLGNAAVAAIDSLQHISMALRSSGGTLTTFRSMMRTALMGAGRIGYAVLPETEAEREANAATILAQEARSLKQALKSFDTFTDLKDLRPTAAETTTLREQINAHPSRPKDGDGAMIQRAAELIGAEVAKREPSAPSGVVADQLAFIWNTSSGAAHGFYWQNDFEGEFVTDLGLVVPAVQYTLEALRDAWE